ncbi:hypothetical protein CHS0354_021402 [Potamilus streckersoni]|uniref:G-protein coupled receptors family 1 profile domain-containing protein n=1 Tax=Potamilus streckersoni TaxID=2493646 RepID=A0AAE0S1P4_9BIVA|nr:hypothetical protein CHS0354_021402 [Potamilus streckersoni]
MTTNITSGNSISVHEALEFQPSQQTKVILYSCFVVAILTVLLNLSTVIFVAKNRKDLRKSPVKQIISLSLSDMLVGLSVIPLIVVFNNIDLLKDKIVCLAVMLLHNMSINATYYHMLGICVQRLNLVRKVTRVNGNKGNMELIAYALLVWVICIVVHVLVGLTTEKASSINECSIRELFGDNYLTFITFIICVYAVPAFLTNILYLVMVIKLRRSMRSVLPTGVPPGAELSNSNPATVAVIMVFFNNHIQRTSPINSIIRTQRKLMITMGTVLLIYDILTAPLFISYSIDLAENRRHGLYPGSYKKEHRVPFNKKDKKLYNFPARQSKPYLNSENKLERKRKIWDGNQIHML